MPTEKEIVFSTAVQYVRELDVPEWGAAAERVMRQDFDAWWVSRGLINYGWGGRTSAARLKDQKYRKALSAFAEEFIWYWTRVS
jgi:hypothetical protein